MYKYGNKGDPRIGLVNFLKHVVSRNGATTKSKLTENLSGYHHTSSTCIKVYGKIETINYMEWCLMKTKKKATSNNYSPFNTYTNTLLHFTVHSHESIPFHWKLAYKETPCIYNAGSTAFNTKSKWPPHSQHIQHPVNSPSNRHIAMEVLICCSDTTILPS